jgi:Tetracyclin repressor-like, C-terminal domain
MAEAHDQLHATIAGRVEDLLASLMPGASPADVTRTAHVCPAVYKSGLELVLAREGAERGAYVQEIKDALIRCPRGSSPGGRPMPPPGHPDCAPRRGCLECG